MLDKQFIRADITTYNPETHKLVITYSFYSLYTYTETFIYKSLNECLLKLAVERCKSGTLQIRNINGELESVSVGDG